MDNGRFLSGVLVPGFTHRVSLGAKTNRNRCPHRIWIIYPPIHLHVNQTKQAIPTTNNLTVEIELLGFITDLNLGAVCILEVGLNNVVAVLADGA